MLPRNDHGCAACALPLDTPETSVLCGQCIGRKRRFSSAVVPYLYRPPIDYMLKRLKFSGELKYARIVAQLLSKAAICQPLPDVLIPVPIHPNRLAERGFNQAELLARHAAQALSLPIDPLAVSRLKDQPAQSQLNANQRDQNLRGAFRATTDLSGKRVALVDDVVTTGATARAVASQLRRARAADISLWAVARTP